MAYRPSPQLTAALGPSNNSSHLHRSSLTPPPINKRDKRRNNMMEKFHEISMNFAENRDQHWRKQHQELQRDLNFITSAEPYQNEPLDEDWEDVEGKTSIPGDEKALPPGKWSRRFVEEVNNAMEDRDAQLTLVAERHNFRIRELKEDHEYAIAVAEKEYSNLMNILRQRLIQSITQRKAQLIKDKEKGDLTDTNPLLLHPTPFGFTNPVSPGGVQSNRKTRHTRHRLEIDDLGNIGESNKRKRKYQIDADEGSPAPNSRAPEVEVNGSGKESQGQKEHNRRNAPFYSMGHLFTDKELVSLQQDASYSVVQDLMTKRRKNLKEQRINGNLLDLPFSSRETVNAVPRGDKAPSRPTKNGRTKSGKLGRNGSAAPTTTNGSDAEENGLAPHADGNVEVEMEDIFLTAPSMDRTANSSIHATRSTRNNANPFVSNGDPTSWNHLGALAGRAAAIRFLGTYSRETKKKEDESNKPSSLTEQEIEDDLAMIAAAIKEEEKAPGKMNEELVAEVLAGSEVDYVGGWPNRSMNGLVA
ncbi:MAG: hypothetical protein LQ342_001910 [Letrouitia transgressa]|nr:MAG: hypothetical protein LQ342_001910 [Letrouitia transgressa]